MGNRAAGINAFLDIGTSKIACVIAEIIGDQIRVIGASHKLAQGIKNGAIDDFKLAENCIVSTIIAAEKMAGVRIDKAHVSISCGSPSTTQIRNTVNIGGRTVTSKDVKKAVTEAKQKADVNNRTIVHTIPVSYNLDEERGITDPINMACNYMSVTTNIANISQTASVNIRNCINKCELDIIDYTISYVASGYAVLSPDELEHGCLLLEIGSGVTGITVFAGGNPIYVDSIPYGGGHITKDIAKCICTPIDCAERTKTLYGSTIPSQGAAREYLDVRLVEQAVNFVNSEEVPISRSVLVSIIKPRVEEMLDMAKVKLEKVGLLDVVGNNMVLTGGGSQLDGLRETVSKIFGKQVRIGNPTMLNGIPDSMLNPAFSSIIGSVIYNYKVSNPYDRASNNNILSFRNKSKTSGLSAVASWLKQNF